MERALQALEAAALRTINVFRAYKIANTLHIMAKMRYSPWDPSLVPKLERMAEALAGTVNAPDVTNTQEEEADTAPEAVGRCGMGKGVAAEAAWAGGGGEGAGHASGEEASLWQDTGISHGISHADTEAALRRDLRVQLQNNLQLDLAQRERDCLLEAIRSKDAETKRLRRLAYGVEVIDVQAGVTRIVVKQAKAGASPPWKRIRKEQAASGRISERFRSR